MCYRHAEITRRVTCPQCGAVNVTRRLHCYQCGALLEPDLLTKPDAAQKGGGSSAASYAAVVAPQHPPTYQPPDR